ncbi:urocanate hydratase-like [Haliotis rubra]|uniref:urocanate hydratase-like n=1 Tax=Haliotis rubra TaxID=36100 RepID=UPI001EE56E39|nr:urocanate hydratase-like [Haliotis rubra]
MSTLKELCMGLPLHPLPDRRDRDDSVPHAPVRTPSLTHEDQRLALENALRYFPPGLHDVLAPEFAQELREYGHIYMYRFRPDVEMRAYPVDEYPSRSRHAASIMHMIMNNLDPHVAQFPHELITYGGNGQVFSNWAQFWIVMSYLSKMTDDQTLVLYSGHPMGLFPSSPSSPRLVVSNGMVVPNYSSREMYEKMFALGVTMYGQMTAGSFCYIGPQGIVHGTTLTVLNAARKHMGTNNLAGKVFVTSGLGGMSGAQAKAAVICGCVGVVAEVSLEAIRKRYNQGWLMRITDDLDDCVAMIRHARKKKEAFSLGYHGNIVSLWERLADEYEQTGDLLVELGSDQTSCHNPYLGGYYPVQVQYDEAREMMHTEPGRFKILVQESLRRQVAAINRLADRGMSFWDYGNAFLLEASRAGADVGRCDNMHGTAFRFPSYVQDIMGDIFSLGFGPFRWVCASGDSEDLDRTDDIAANVLEDILKEEVPETVKQLYQDNLRWIREASQHKLVSCTSTWVFSEGNTIRGVSTKAGESHVYLGFSGACELHVYLGFGGGNTIRGVSTQAGALHVYWGLITEVCAPSVHRGEVINGGFGLVLDGTLDSALRAKRMLSWDVSNGVARRCWSGNSRAEETICRAMESDPKLKVTIPYHVKNPDIIDKALNG